jgi:hypothetical protein
MELLSHYPGHRPVYTDGSFLQGTAGSACIYNGQAFCCRLLGFNSVLTAELCAVYRAFLFICRQPRRRLLSLEVLCNVSAVTLPTTVLLLRSCFIYSTCAPRGSLWCFAGYLDTVAYLATWLPMWQPCTDRSFQMELSALTFALAFIALFYPRCKPSETLLLATNFVWWKHLCRSRSPRSEPSGRTKSPSRVSGSVKHAWQTDTLTRGAGACLYTLFCPSYRGIYLGGLSLLCRSPPYLSFWRSDLRHTLRKSVWGVKYFGVCCCILACHNELMGSFFYSVFVFVPFMSSLRRLTHCTLPGLFTAWQI